MELIGISLSQQAHKLVDTKTGIRNDATQGARAHPLVIWNHDARVGRVASQDHMTSSLSPKYEACAFQGAANFTTGEVGGKLAHAASISTNSLPLSVGTGSPASRQSSI